MRSIPIGMALALALAGCSTSPLGTGAPPNASCSSCHGSPDNPAPPKGVNGETATTDVAVGAHQSHLKGSAIRGPLDCSECHPVPDAVDSPGHADGKIDLVWGALATTSGLSPSFDSDSQRCSSTWCHGAAIGGGTNKKPIWTQVGTGQADCGTCHGVPPPDPHPADSACNKCHPATANPDGTINLSAGRHIDGHLQASRFHPTGWDQGTAHGAQAKAAGLSSCEQCHGADLNGGGVGVSCNQCHDGWKTNCTFCHGGTDNATGAPPVDTHGATATTEVTVGAHSSHLKDSALRKAIGCNECHVVPADALSDGHIDQATATLTFGALATTAGLAPSWDRNQARCSSTYCHGATLAGGSNKAPQWTLVDGTQVACGTCHGAPPPAPHAQETNCSQCHPGTVKADGTIDVAGGLHMDGQIQALTSGHPAGWIDTHGAVAKQGINACTVCHGPDLTGGASGVSCDQCHSGWKTNCVFCHGGKDNQTGAPPVDTHGEAATSSVTVGAHSAHLVDSALRQAIGCNECHVVPTDALSAGHIDGPTATLTFGALATTSGLTPAWDRTSGKCSSVYCHGTTIHGGTNKAPTWTAGAGEVACGTCHGNPPPYPHVQSGTCDLCHPDTVNPDGTINVAGGKHINGAIDSNGQHPAGWQDGAVHGPAAEANISSCEACHGADLNGGSAGISCDTCHNGWKTNCVFCHGGTDNQTGAPPKDTHGATATSSVTIGAHSSHLMAKSGIASPIACTECHVVPTDALSSGHMDAATATLTFGTLATTGGSTPSWNRTTAQCSSAYCHGASLSSGSNKTPTWTTVNGTQAACGTCHALPPTGSWPGFPNGTFTHQKGQHSSYDCSKCHPDATKTSITTPALHINGKADINSTASGCTCHD
jgi:predicted CxxxxCH...CXXCH cytochrome family protein